jgi:hypothetical protein
MRGERESVRFDENDSFSRMADAQPQFKSCVTVASDAG